MVTPGAVKVADNTDPAWSSQFPPIQTRRMRLLVTKTKDNISRIWEVEFYQPAR